MRPRETKRVSKLWFGKIGQSPFVKERTKEMEMKRPASLKNNKITDKMVKCEREVICYLEV